ncbi:MAG: lipid-binding SYLF domain-containing protein [Synergistaceae bacterium]|nr:lipid-binding SYLF domain-containing protein [Synergistaceae bacterium]
MRNGKRRNRIILAAALVLLLAAFGVTPAPASDAESLIKNSVRVLKEMESENDVKDMAHVLEGAHAVAFVPSMVKAGFILGGEYGEGLVLRKEGNKWFGPSFYNLGGGSVGLQIGVQKTAFVLVVNNKDGVEAFLRSKTKLGADVAVAAGPVGRRGDAATDAQMKASIYSYSMAKGLFAGVSLDGSVLSISVKRNREYWKKDISADEALKRPATDKRIRPLIQEIEKITRKAK